MAHSTHKGNFLRGQIKKGSLKTSLCENENFSHLCPRLKVTKNESFNASAKVQN